MWCQSELDRSRYKRNKNASDSGRGRRKILRGIKAIVSAACDGKHDLHMSLPSTSTLPLRTPPTQPCCGKSYSLRRLALVQGCRSVGKHDEGKGNFSACAGSTSVGIRSLRPTINPTISIGHSDHAAVRYSRMVEYTPLQLRRCDLEAVHFHDFLGMRVQRPGA